jgi:rubrerythrin
MKAIDRRLRRLQERLAPQENEEVGRLVELLRERRRRRAEASGESFDDPSLESLDGTRRTPQSIAEILRARFEPPRTGRPM